MSKKTEQNPDQLSDRKQQLLSVIIEDYVTTAKPVGSKLIAEKKGFDVSPATIRNEMKELEDMGYITHPHTSAGRIPTAKGYKFYVEHFVNREAELRASALKQLKAFTDTMQQLALERRVKELAKYLAESSQEAVLVKIGKNNLCIV